jgi:putative transposase
VAQVARIRLTERGSVPLGVHLRCRFHRCELIGPAVGEAASVFGRFQSGDPNEQWKGDEMHGPHVADRQTYLSAFLDDQSRLLAGYPFGFAAESARGVPAGNYVDDDSACCDAAATSMRGTRSTPCTRHPAG